MLDAETEKNSLESRKGRGREELEMNPFLKAPVVRSEYEFCLFGSGTKSS